MLTHLYLDRYISAVSRCQELSMKSIPRLSPLAPVSLACQQQRCVGLCKPIWLKDHWNVRGNKRPELSIKNIKVQPQRLHSAKIYNTTKNDQISKFFFLRLKKIMFECRSSTSDDILQLLFCHASYAIDSIFTMLRKFVIFKFLCEMHSWVWFINKQHSTGNHHRISANAK